MTGRRWAQRIALLFVTAGLAAGCSAGPSQRPGIVVRDAPPATTQEPGGEPEVPPLENMTDSMAWRDCSEEIRERLVAEELPGWLPVRCGKINAVLDSPYAPGRGIARLQLLRAGEGKVPLVVVNDVDGLPGTIYAAHLAKTLPQAFFEKFTLIGVDRRGTGNSAAAGCVPEEVRRAIVDPDPADLPIDVWLQAAQTAGQQCSIQLETQLPAIDTWRTAADLETLREALGVPRLNGIGHGEGSRVLSVFADRFPERVGRVVLDGVPDPTQDAAVALEGVAKGAEAAFDAFSTDCVARRCELGSQPKRALLNLLGELRTNPVTEPQELDITAGSALHAIMIALGDKARWPALSAAIAKAGDGDPTGFVDLLVPAGDRHEPAGRHHGLGARDHVQRHQDPPVPRADPAVRRGLAAQVPAVRHARHAAARAVQPVDRAEPAAAHAGRVRRAADRRARHRGRRGHPRGGHPPGGAATRERHVRVVAGRRTRRAGFLLLHHGRRPGVPHRR